MSRLVFLFLFLVSSCSAITHNFIGMGSFVDADEFYRRFPDNRKSVVVLGYDFKYRDPIYWCLVDDLDYKITNVAGCRQIEISNSHKIVMLEPGLYKMVKYSLRKDDYIFGAKESRISDKDSLNFEVKPAQIYYVGNLKKSGRGYKVKDEYAKILRAINTKNYQELLETFDESLDKLEWLVDLENKMVKNLAFKKSDPKKKKVEKKQCPNACDKKEIREIRKRKREVELDRHKYNRKYLNKLMKELNFDKKRCGIK